MGLFLSPPEINYTTILLINSSTTEVFLGGGGGGGYICPYSEFQTRSFHALKRRPCHCAGTILFVIFLTAVTVSTNFRVIGCHFICLMSLNCQNFTLTGSYYYRLYLQSIRGGTNNYPFSCSSLLFMAPTLT